MPQPAFYHSELRETDVRNAVISVIGVRGVTDIEHITQRIHDSSLPFNSNNGAKSNNRTDSTFCSILDEAHNDQKLAEAKVNFF